jgi:hypothetical protein
MPQPDPQTKRLTKSKTDLLPPAKASANGAEDMLNFQSQFYGYLFGYLQDVNQSWFALMQAEATVASEFASKLTAARSVADCASAYQQWLSRHMELLAQDGQRLFADTQKLMTTGARAFTNGSAQHHQ